MGTTRIQLSTNYYHFKINTKATITEVLNKNQGLIAGVDKLISMTKAEDFLAWLLDINQIIHWHMVNKKPYDESEDHHYTVIMMIEGIAIPWLTAKKDMKEKMAKGFQDILDYRGSESFRSIVPLFLDAHFFNRGDRSFMHQDILGIQILLEICNTLPHLEKSKN